jgi:EAL domain-containing protein (putative c-di-GMP-specific phosphodiesterase class I)
VSGDEFAVLTETSSSEMVRRLAMQILDAAERPLALEGAAQIRPSMSIGSSCGIREVTAVEALRQADAALHRAKVRGKGRLHCFDDRLRTQVRERLLIEADFLPALVAGEVLWRFQPQVDLRTGRVFGLEALCRWHHADLGPIPPARFVPVVESMGRARELFLAALESVLAAQRDLKGEIGSLVPVSVNLSAELLDDDLLADRVSGALEHAGAEEGDLWIEVTESAAAEPGAERTLKALHEMGLRLAVDDFGTGWSSMSRLADFPWDSLKVDHSFVAPLGAGRSSGPHEHVVAAMVALAHSLDLLVVAEGVETPEQLAAVRELGCDVVQGWLFSRAVEVRELHGLIDRRGGWMGPGSDAPDTA